MKNRILIILIVSQLFLQNNVKSQEEDYKPLTMVHVLCLSGHAGFGIAKAQFNKNGTNWKHPFAFDVHTGIGASYLMKNTIAFEANFQYEINRYYFSNTGVTLGLGYSLPEVDLKIKKIFRKEEKTNYFVRVGIGYLFGGNATKSKDEAFYNYSMSLVSSSSLLLIPEIGMQTRLGKSNFINYSLIYQYGFSNIFTTSTTYRYDLLGSSEISSSVTKGNFIGIQLKYYRIVKEYSKEVNSGRQVPDKRF